MLVVLVVVVVVVVMVVVVAVTDLGSVVTELCWKLLEPTHPSTCTPHAEYILDMSAVL